VSIGLTANHARGCGGGSDNRGARERINRSSANWLAGELGAGAESGGFVVWGEQGGFFGGIILASGYDGRCGYFAQMREIA
jgi:hypothetical protein